jgi:hypothetical protein
MTAKSGGAEDSFAFLSGDTLRLFFSAYSSSGLTTNAVFRDVSAWYHIVLAVDTTQATASNRVKMYVNGVQQTFTGSDYPSQNATPFFNTALEHFIGRYANQFMPTGNFNGYMADINFIDGQQLAASSFGETDADTGVWKPKAYSGSYGTNGFYLKFADNSGTTSTTLGKDSSGNSNNWTPNNFSVTAGAGNDSLVDSPTPYGTDTGAGGEVRGNYCTWNFLDKNGYFTLTNGNLNAGTTFSNWVGIRATFGVSTGKWYWEILVNGSTATRYTMVGIIDAAGSLDSYIGAAAKGYGYNALNGQKYNNATAASYGSSFTAGDVIGIALDMDNGTLVFYKNGVSQGTAYSSLSGTYFPATSNYADFGTSDVDANFGQRPFAYTAPSGFKALCTTNLPTPTIGATATTRADDYFNTVLYTGNTPSTNVITGVGFAPDFVWVKSRTVAESHNLVDKVRGNNLRLKSNETAAEASATFTLDSDGFTVGANSESNTGSMVGWAWKGNGAGSSNTQGTITSTVSANTTAGFSVVTYTGNATAGATVGHGLGATPSMIIVKDRVATSGAREWIVYHSSLGNTQALYLNTTGTAYTGTNLWNNTSPTSTVFTVGNSSEGTNGSGNAMVAYCFAPVAGYSAFGSYTGNASTDGPFIYTGFRPKYVMTKRTGQTSNWTVHDTVRSPYNVTNAALFPNLTVGDNTGPWFDIVSNGFKIRSDGSDTNSSTATYIYAAFAENPFKYSLAR